MFLHFKKTEFYMVVALAVAAAWIRIPGLGKWCLAIDEFYFSQSVMFILENGIPRFPDGGYYLRGIGLQYLTAAPMLLLQNRELAARLFPVAFGILSIPMFYMLSRKFLSPASAAVSSLLLLLSSWHIEFSRFARMYAPFQFFLFLFVYFLYSGYYENKEKAKTGAWIVAFLSILVYEGSVFLPAFFVIVFATRDTGTMKNRMSLAAGILLLMIANYLFHGISFKEIGVSDPLPPQSASQWYPSDTDFPLHLPDITLLLALAKSPAYYVPFIFFIVGGIAVFFRKLGRERNRMNVLVLAFLLSLALIHQFGMVVLTASLYFILRKESLAEYLKSYRDVGVFLLVFLVFWVCIAYFSGNIEKIKGYLVGYPAFKYRIYMDFAEVVPIWGSVSVVILAVSIGKSLLSRNKRPIEPILAILVLSLALVAVLKAPVYVHTTRYCFPFYPLVFIVGMFELESLWLRRVTVEIHPLRKYVVLTIPLFLMFITEDYHIRHILNASSKEINFRMGEYSRYAGHWYPRADTRGPVAFVDNVYKEGDVIVLEDPPMSPYLSKPYVNYINLADVRIPYSSRKAGKEEMWTGKPLIYEEGQLAEMVPDPPDHSLWLVAVRQDYIDTSFSTRNPPESLSEKFGLDVELRHAGVDGRIGAWEIRRRGAGRE